LDNMIPSRCFGLLVFRSTYNEGLSTWDKFFITSRPEPKILVGDHVERERKLSDLRESNIRGLGAKNP